MLLLGIGSSCGDYLAGGPTPTILSVMEGVEKAPHETAFLGTRRIHIQQPWEGGQVSLEFTEEVAADGQGQFAIHTQDVVNSNGLDPFLFQQIQDSRAGFFWRYRDFSIKTWNNFAGNWQVLGLGSMTSVAGRQAWQLDIERKLGQKTYYRIAVDIETGLVLRCVELAGHGDSGLQVPVASFEYESIDFEPDLSGVAWHVASNNEQLLEFNVGLKQQLGFEPILPMLSPVGYELQETARVQDGTGRTWLKLNYSDGIDNVFFLHGAPLPGEPQPFGGSVNSGGASAPGNEKAGEDEALFIRSGTVTLVEANIGHYDLIAVGKVDAYDLMVMIQSALP